MQISDAVNAEFDELVSVRRHFHKHPELAFEEIETAEFIANKLKSIDGISEIKEQIGVTGVTAVIRTTNKSATPTKCVALRADMDALPLQETATVEYVGRASEASEHPCCCRRFV